VPGHKKIHTHSSKKNMRRYKPKSGKGFGSVDGRLRTRNMRTKAKRATKRRK
tara:strand:+ start:182 stop:337 length:156 start_codon:yes stop_codon:yes gene_type:complete